MNDAPDANCYTMPDGSCVGEGCMHDPKPRGAWVGVLTNPTVIAKKRQEHRESWDDAVKNAWHVLGHDQQDHCTNPDIINRWWPGTSPKDES